MADLRAHVATFPQTPGVYQFKDVDGNILYIGKAKRLRARVSSYFRNIHALEPSKRIMVNRAATIDYIVTSTEIEALVLESNLIKQHRPPYNVIMRDDKQYKWIKISWRETFPKILQVRNVEQDGGQYFGPFTDSTAVNQTLTYLKKIFRYCDVAETKPARKPCFDFYIKRCLGACVGKITQTEYNQIIEQAARFLAGQTDEVVRDLKEQMKHAAETKQFELAARLRDQLHDIEHVLQRQRAIFPSKVDWDVVGMVLRGNHAAVNILHVRGGKLLGRESLFLDLHGERDESVILGTVISTYYAERLKDLPAAILLQSAPSDAAILPWLRTGREFIKLIVPSRGDKKKLLDLAIANAKEAWQRRSETLPESVSRGQVLADLARILDLPNPPHRIECYDISHTQGLEQVGSMVVMLDGVESPAEYRKFKIHRGADIGDGVPTQSDDVASMKEVLTRRLSHLPDHKDDEDLWPRPDLVVIDGGRAQLNAALSVWKENNIATRGANSIPVIGLAKRLEELVIPNRKESLILPLDTPALSLMRHLRDEAHRFAITFHRKRRGQRGLTSWLDTIDGIGPITRKKLIRHFGSGAAVRRATLEELIAVVGPALAEKIEQSGK